jgi:hypothetical protein
LQVGAIESRHGYYFTERDGKLVYRGAHFARIVWGRVVEERIFPDAKALSAALE